MLRPRYASRIIVPALVSALAIALALAAVPPAGAQGPDVQIAQLSCSGDPELVVIENFGDTAQTLAGWELQSDPPDSETFDLAVLGSLAPGASISIQSGPSAGGVFKWGLEFIYRDDDPTDYARIVDDTGAIIHQVNCAEATPTPSPTPSPEPSPVGEVPNGGGAPPLTSPPPFREREFPLNRLKKAGLHEIKPASYRDAPASVAFALAAIGERIGAEQQPPLILWCLTAKAAHEWGRPYGPGLFAFGLDPACLLIVEARTEIDAAWALEEGLKSRALTAALGQVAIEAPLVSRRLGIEMRERTELFGGKRRGAQIAMDEVDAAAAAPFACADADMAGRLRAVLEPDLESMGMTALFSDIEMPLLSVLARMELSGVAIDVGALRELSATLAEEIGRVEEEIYKSVGHEFNISSPQQLSHVLFEELHLPRTRRLKTGAYTTDAQALEGLRGLHDVIDLIYSYRELTKLKSTYLDALPALVNAETNRLHTEFNQAGAATGRLSSRDPNLQNIPVRTALGEEVRRAFVARDVGP
ncbi:hypothetical protein LCGC14_2127110, partial [marine sediment metagenome]